MLVLKHLKNANRLTGLFLLFCTNWGFCYLILTGITKFKYERKNEMNSGLRS